MKSEQRHELEKNILADRIGDSIESARPMLPMIFGAIAIAIVGALGWGWYSSSARSQAALAWTDYYFNLTTSSDPASYFDLAARDPEAFLDVADDFPSSSAAKWALQSAGGRFLEQGIEALYRNRAEGEKLLNQAIESFESAAESSEPSLQTKAHYGLGRAYEALSKLSEATKEYEQVVNLAAYEGLAEDAKKRLDFIASEEGKKFYAWFATLDPKPDAPIRLPNDLSVPPTNPGDMSFDPVGSLTPPTSAAEDAAASGTVEATAPATTEANIPPVAENAPAELPSSTEGVLDLTPATTQPPATQPPAAQPPATQPPTSNPEPAAQPT